jgi:crossover junction endodeoxyribonuclease RuvC
MIIFGIDPGIATTGYGIIEKKGNSHTLLDYGVIITKKETPFSKRLLLLASDLATIIKTYNPETIAIEDLFFNNNAKTAMVVAQARGVIMLTAEQSNASVFSYTPLQVKSAVTGHGFADKKQVQYMVRRLLNLQKTPRPDDAADALALAICHGHSYKLKSLR